MATHDATAEADASAVTGTGIFESLLDTGVCKHVDTKSTAKGKETSGPCGRNLNSNQVDAFTQVASASGSSAAPGNQTDQNGDPVVANKGLKPGTSAAVADVAGPIDLTDPAFALDLSDLSLSLAENTIENVVGDIAGPILGNILVQLQAVTDTLDSILNPLLSQVSGVLPLALHVRGVFAQCSATPGNVTGDSTVAGVALDIDLGGQLITVPLDLPTEPNSPLLVTAPQDLVDGIIYGATPEDPLDGGLQQTLAESLGGALSPINLLLTDAVALQILDPLLETLEPTLLEQLNGLLEPLVTGTVNKQQTTGGHLEVTALEVILLGSNELDTAKVGCGPNTAGTPHTATPTPTPTDGDDSDDGDGDDGDGDDGDGDDGDGPKSVDSGLNDGGNLGALAITGLLAASTLVGSAARQRLLLDR